MRLPVEVALDVSGLGIVFALRSSSEVGRTGERGLITVGFDFLAFWSGVGTALAFLGAWFNIYGGIQGLTSTVFLGFRLHHAVLGAFLLGLVLILYLKHRDNFIVSIIFYFFTAFSLVLIGDDLLWHTYLCNPGPSNNFTCPAPFF